MKKEMKDLIDSRSVKRNTRVIVVIASVWESKKENFQAPSVRK